MIQREVTIGRASGSDILYGADCPYVSNNHALIYSDGYRLILKDMSTNGTYINNNYVHHQSVVINYGDLILLAGKYPLTWEQISIFFPVNPGSPKTLVYSNNKLTLHNPNKMDIVDNLPKEEKILPSLSFGQAITNVFLHYADFSGRARRSEYWWFVLLNCMLSWIPYIGVLWGLIIIVPALALCVRRLHDIGRSGWFYFIVLIPIVGWIILVVWFCQDSDKGTNKYGPNPKIISA